MQKAKGFNNIAIVYIKGNAYRIHFWNMSKDDTINIMNDSNLADKRGCFIKKNLLYIKMSESAYLTYDQTNRDVILNGAKDYYENDKERLREK